MNPVAKFHATVEVKDIGKIKSHRGDQHYGNADRVIGEILLQGGTVELTHEGKVEKTFASQDEYDTWQNS